MVVMLSFSSLTAAQKSRRLLQDAGIPAFLRKGVHPQTGCYFQLLVPAGTADQARKLLQLHSAHRRAVEKG